MSSILDALKKSEAERQRGTPPTLDSPIVFQRRPAPSRRRSVWLLPAVALAALAGAWYGGLLPWPAASEPEDSAGPASAPTAAAEAVAVNPDQAPAAAAAGDPAPMAAPAAPPPAAAAGETADTRRRGTFGGAALGEAAGPPSSDVEAVDPADGAAAAAQAATVAPPPAPAPAAPVDPALPPFESGAAPAPPQFAQAAGPGAEAAAAPGAGPPSIHDLPFSVRRELPELKVTMHMYSADPQRRFVLLNGVRARDGESLEGGLEVVEIRATDVVLRFQGTEFLLPLRG